MNCRLVHSFARAALLYAFPGFLFDAIAKDLVPSDEAIRAAVAKSLSLLETGARGSMEKRKQCFTCHNQALPIMALNTARSRGITIDAENLRRQVQFTADFLGKNRTNYLDGKGQGGQALTAGYALWTLEMGGWKPDETTDSVAEFLLKDVLRVRLPTWRGSVHLDYSRRLGDDGACARATRNPVIVAAENSGQRPGSYHPGATRQES